MNYFLRLFFGFNFLANFVASFKTKIITITRNNGKSSIGNKKKQAVREEKST